MLSVTVEGQATNASNNKPSLFFFPSLSGCMCCTYLCTHLLLNSVCVPSTREWLSFVHSLFRVLPDLSVYISPCDGKVQVLPHLTNKHLGEKDGIVVVQT